MLDTIALDHLQTFPPALSADTQTESVSLPDIEFAQHPNDFADDAELLDSDWDIDIPEMEFVDSDPHGDIDDL